VLEALGPLRVLGQQVTQIGRGPVGPSRRIAVIVTSMRTSLTYRGDPRPPVYPRLPLRPSTHLGLAGPGDSSARMSAGYRRARLATVAYRLIAFRGLRHGELSQALTRGDLRGLALFMFM
jgi:hypothetical protein